MKLKIAALIMLSIVLIFGFLAIKSKRNNPKITAISTVPAPTPTLSPPSVSPSPLPSPKPLTASQSSQLYGPCVNLPVLMYHHVQPEKAAKADGQVSLTVDTTIFQKQLEYLKNKNYHSISPSDLTSFFDHHTPLPSKPVLLTFDDGYADFASDVVPLLKQYAFQATMFIPTGLIDNPGYLTWASMKEIASSGLVTFANHTWSHHSMNGTLTVIQKEVSLAKTQLNDHGYTSSIFAYPYGTVSQTALNYLSKDNFSLAFTTRHGSLECKQQRLQLPRIRVGNASLIAYGL